MTTENDVLGGGDFMKQKLPTSINVLTILTFIGCAIGLIGGIFSYSSADSTYEQMQKAASDPAMEELPGFLKGMVGPEALPMYQKMAENKLPILVVLLIGIGLCLYGAIQMRKLKKQGYLLYVVGEVLPFIGSFIFVGAMAFKGFGLLTLIVPIVFILLYTVNKKHLVN